MKRINTEYKRKKLFCLKQRLNVIAIGILLAYLSILPQSCEKFLEVSEPTNQISQTTVFKDKKLALSALSDVYTNLRANGMLKGDLNGLNNLLGCYADEIMSYTNQALDYRTFYELNVQQNTSVVDAMWVNAYKQIYAVNNIIEGIEESHDYLDETTSNQIRGEAYFIRALLHFYLVNLYGEIPYIATTHYQDNQLAERMPITEVYTKLIADLKQAEQQLPSAYPSSSRVRANQAAAQLLLSRVYLYQKDWSKAKEYATKVVNNSLYLMEQDLSKTFLKDSKSVILQWMPADVGINTLEGQYFTFTTVPPANVALSSSLLNSFESNDQRKQKWIKTLSNSQNSYSHAYKYKLNNKTTTSQEYSIVLRVEEAYLILAESNNELGNTFEALANLNIIRTKAGLNIYSSTSQSDIRVAIFNERRHEFFTEFGHRFFDLKRSGQLDTVMGALKSNWKTYMAVLPIPERELFANPNLKPQNNGY